MDAGRKQLAAKLAKLKAGAAGEGKGEGDSGEYGIGWGFDEDAVAEEEDDEEEGMEGGDEDAVRHPIPIRLCDLWALLLLWFVSLLLVIRLAYIRALRISVSLPAGLLASD